MATAGIATFPHSSGSRTAQYIAINDKNKDLVLAMADMSILETASTLDSTLTTFWLPQLHQALPSHLVLDGNWAPESLSRWLRAAADISAHVTFEPVSTSKSTHPFQLPAPHSLAVFPSPSIHLTTPNTYELNAMYAAAQTANLFERPDWWAVIDALGIPSSGARVRLAMATTPSLVDRGLPQQCLQLLPFIPTICLKLGKDGVLVTQLLAAGDARLERGDEAPWILSRCANGTEGTLGVGGVYMRLFPGVEDVKGEDVVSVNGVGDTFAGTLVAGLAARRGKKGVEQLIDIAQRAAVLTLKSTEAVSPELGTLRSFL
jgi:pseudouridine-5'-phosphate glycosidase/pseudouridine kinase